MSDDRRGSFRGGRGGGFSSGPREMHKATCADCGQETEVPFKPSGDRPVYCRECYQKHKPKRY
jgi:CxxC-x17-CxxC domain-containing protein